MSNRMRLTWNPPAACWLLDILDENGTAIVAGMAVVTGADLIDQYGYLGIGGQIIAQTDHETDAVPTFENLGNTGHIYFLTP